MNFVIAPEKKFWWPVKVKTPSEKEVGTFDVQEFEVQFKIISLPEIREIEASILAEQDPALREVKVDDVIRHAVTGWRGVQDQEGGEVAFSKQTLDQCLGFVWFREGIYEAFRSSSRGDAAKVKN